MIDDKFRQRAEAVARGEWPKPHPKAKAKSCPTVKTKSAPKPKPKATAPKPATWAQAVAFIAKRDGCSASVAGRKACGEFPELRPTQGRKA